MTGYSLRDTRTNDTYEVRTNEDLHNALTSITKRNLAQPPTASQSARAYHGTPGGPSRYQEVLNGADMVADDVWASLTRQPRSRPNWMALQALEAWGATLRPLPTQQ